MLTRRIMLTISLMLALACAALAGVPGIISYQGKLMQPSGAPVPDGTYSIRFAVYDSPTADTPLWSETNGTVQVKGGLFSVLLGSTNNLPANIFDSADRYFAIKVGTDAEMVPRQRIGSVAFAARAASADIALTVPDGSITTAKLADQSVTADKLMPGAATPSGTISMFAGATPPVGWLICDGSAVSRTTYASMFAVIGTAYGAGDGSTTFNLPNMQDRFAVGKSTAKELGALGGAATMNLAHSHVVDNHSHSIINDGYHTHWVGGILSMTWGWDWRSDSTHGVGGIQHDHGDTSGNGSHSHGGATGGATPGTNSQLSAAQDIMNPYVVVNYIIKL